MAKGNQIRAQEIPAASIWAGNGKKKDEDHMEGARELPNSETQKKEQGAETGYGAT